LKELADKHQHQGIYIIQSTALVNLVGNYGKTDLDKARYYYDLLEKLADKHQNQEIYITQAKALVNLGDHYSKTDHDKTEPNSTIAMSQNYLIPVCLMANIHTHGLKVISL
jgi:SAM-dependent MidA family methyltransferase